jgi:hypothetical protein
VVSDIPAHREFLDKETAELVSQYDEAGSVAKMILRTLQNRSVLEVRRNRAANLARNWTISRSADAFEALFTSLSKRSAERSQQSKTEPAAKL